jgi:uncharacterized alpha/beta hydrolase family protein
MKQAIITLIVLVFVAAIATDFHAFLKVQYYQKIPLKELQVRPKEPTPLIYILIRENCPNKLGKLAEFLECRERVLEKYAG